MYLLEHADGKRCRDGDDDEHQSQMHCSFANITLYVLGVCAGFLQEHLCSNDTTSGVGEKRI